MKKENIEEIIHLLQNPTRRKILEFLSREEHYPLELSRSLNTSQQAISKHLKTLEEHGLVDSKKGKSSRGGPPTKTYKVNSELCLRIDLGSRIFGASVERLDGETIEGYEDLDEKIEREKEKRYGSLKDKRELLEEVEEEMEELERKRRYLLKKKEELLGEAYGFIRKNFEGHNKRNLLYYMINNGTTNPEKLSAELDVRRDEMKRLIDEIEKKIELW